MNGRMIIDAVSEMSRNRSVTHIIMSHKTYRLYSDNLTEEHLRKGMRHSSCHDVNILTLDGLLDNIILSFNCNRAKTGSKILRLVREENFDDALTMIDSVLNNKRAKWLHAAWFGGSNNETARK